ncbi:transposase [Streptomyces sp. NPDC002491]
MAPAVPLPLVVTGEQRADRTQFKPVLEEIRIPRTGRGRPRKKPDSLAADRAYSNGRCREYLRRRGIRHTFPEKADSQSAGLRKCSCGGRPPGFDEDRYKKRNIVEGVANFFTGHVLAGREAPVSIRVVEEVVFLIALTFHTVHDPAR